MNRAFLNQSQSYCIGNFEVIFLRSFFRQISAVDNMVGINILLPDSLPVPNINLAQRPVC